MRTLKNITSIRFYLCFITFLGSKSLFCQVEPSKNDVFCANDSVKFFTDKQSDLIKLNRDLAYESCFDILISSQGITNSILHIELRDSLIKVYEYSVVKDTLKLISQKKGYPKSSNITNLRGYYQYYSFDKKRNKYFKEISIFKNSELVSKFLFDGVAKSNLRLPNYKEIAPLISLLNELEKY